MTKIIKATYEIVMSAGREAGNKTMRTAGRTSWNEEDFDTAAEVMNALYQFVAHPEDSEIVLNSQKFPSAKKGHAT